MDRSTLRRIAASLGLATLVCSPANAQSTGRPHFIAESLSAFGDAYARVRQVRLDVRHADEKRYHAFRFTGSGPAVIIARSVTVDAAGHLHIKQEPGTTAHGQIVSGGGDTHILLPLSVTPPQ